MAEIARLTQWLQLCLVWSLTFQTVYGYYCEWDQCGSTQYCCGDNLCCEYVYSLWYFWVGILFVVILLSACGGLFRYCYYNSPPLVVHRITSYVRVPNAGSIDEPERYLKYKDQVGSRPSCSNVKLPGYFPSQGPPPPYSASVAPPLGKQRTTEHNQALYP